MDTLHLNTYLHLIEALLQCAKGEEWLLLQQHEQLIDAELVSVMEQVTEQLNQEGNLPAAKFLHYWTAQLNHLLQQNPPPTSSGQNNNHANGSIDPAVEIAKQRQPDLASAPSTSPQLSNHLEELLANISNRLEKLETSIDKHQNPSNPLWYMSILEQAEAQGWIVSSEEVEQLIGMKPHCAPDRNFFVRGCWKFEKAGKVGMHSSWRVTKEIVNPSIVDVSLPSGTAFTSAAATRGENRIPEPESTKLELDLSSPWAEK
ncbi:hypothetical protein [Chamaesiphon sp. VAR_48_metabat_135_sub]|uniref:hypothetical protein n=1 Tax=Chamaesiphon sp. VAR_48_metabat_135_sub TaxID=2964699 RepID=UPI00286ADC86|nr:hypothetical protein [Chamaesiphon sp. VAR_48_metabat_135_sub]